VKQEKKPEPKLQPVDLLSADDDLIGIEDNNPNGDDIFENFTQAKVEEAPKQIDFKKF